MRKLLLVFLIFTFCCIGVLFITSLFILRTVITESPETSFYNPSNSFLPTNLDDTMKSPVYLKEISDIKNDFISESKNFLEINFSEMEVRLYQEGKLIKEVPILAVGDPQSWGGSAAGLYKIMSGNKLSFSIVSEVYMPYALRYYGKYYLHGEPYYPDGKKLISSVSGGCIRLSDKDAKDIYELTELDMPVLVIDKEKDYYQYPNKKLSDFPEISAESYLAADLDSGFVFAEKNSDEKLPIASLAKLMTALVVAENVDLRKSMLVEPEMLQVYGTTQGLEAGKRFRVVELFYPLLIESSDDAAEVLGYFLGRGKTIKMMNEKTKAILMGNTEFVDLRGFDAKNVSTARDLFHLARYILNNRPPLLEITKGKQVRSFGEVRFNVKDFWNENVFIDDPSFVGGKTGYLPQSKYTGIFIFKFLTEDEKSRNIVIILLGSGDNQTDTQKIYKWLSENYRKLTIK